MTTLTQISRNRNRRGLRITVVAIAIFTAQSLRADIEVSSNFPGGSGTVERIDQATGYIRLMPEDHPERGWRCWWYVRLLGLTPGQTITLDVGDSPWATPDRATYSVDNGKTWKHSPPGRRTQNRIQYALPLDSPTVLVAWGPPFVPADAQQLVEKLANAGRGASHFSLCTTRENRQTPALRVGPANEDPAAPKRPLLWIQARQHAWESGSSWVCRGLAEWILSDQPSAIKLRERTEIVIVPIMDIDNVYRGAGGKNQRPQDHNRDWSRAPHWHAVAAAQSAIQVAASQDRLAVFVDLHNPSARDRQPYFYLPPKEILSSRARNNQAAFLGIVKERMTGPLAFTGRTIESGPRYDPKMWESISKNWVARLGTDAVSVTLETAWNTPVSTTDGYQTVGRQLGEALAQYMEPTL